MDAMMQYYSGYEAPLLSKLIDTGNLLAGWRRVRDNHGCAGADGVTIEEFEYKLPTNLSLLAKEISCRRYRPLPLLRILVDKGNRESRALSVPTVRDRLAQSAALNILEPVFEAQFEHCSYAYRKRYSWQQAVQKIIDYYDQGYRWVLDADINALFDSVPHDKLLDKVERVVQDKELCHLTSLWVRAEIWDGTQVSRLIKGIPQGSVISPMLANLYLDELDGELLNKGIRLVRYADDFVVLCKTREKATAAAQLTKDVLKGMELSLDESDIVSFEQGFRFLGVVFLRSDALIPFGKERKPQKVRYVPPPMNPKAYWARLLPGQNTRKE